MPIDSRPRKILMILESCYPTEGGGGAEGQVRTIARYLHRRGVPVQIVTPMTREAPQVEHELIDGVPVWRIPYPKIRLLGGFFMLGRLALYLLKERRNYDVIHAHIAHNMAAVSAAVGHLLNKPTIVKLTGWLELRHGVLAAGRNPLMSLKRAALKSATYMQATSSQIRARLIARGFDSSRVLVIPNAVEMSRFADAANNREVREDLDRPLTGVYLGRLVAEKGLDTLLEAWKRAFAKDDNVQLLVIGEGQLRDRIQRWVREQGRERQIHLLGAKPDVDRYLADAHFGILPSLYEGLSNTLLEYMASGLPVLGTRVSGTEDFIEHDRCGWLVETGDHEAMAACLEQIASMDRGALAGMGEAARQRVAARAGIDAVIGRLAEIYRIKTALRAAAAASAAGGQGTCAE